MVNTTLESRKGRTFEGRETSGPDRVWTSSSRWARSPTEGKGKTTSKTLVIPHVNGPFAGPSAGLAAGRTRHQPGATDLAERVAPPSPLDRLNRRLPIARRRTRKGQCETTSCGPSRGVRPIPSVAVGDGGGRRALHWTAEHSSSKNIAVLVDSGRGSGDINVRQPRWTCRSVVMMDKWMQASHGQSYPFQRKGVSSKWALPNLARPDWPD